MEGKTAYIKCSQVMETLVNEGAALLTHHGEDVETAERGGKEFAYCVMTHFSAQKVYFPKFTVDAARKRLKAISDDVQETRKSAAEVAKEYGINITVAYQIIQQTMDLTTNGGADAHCITRGIAIEAARMLITHGVAPSDAATAARGFASVLVARWGGMFLSFPKLEIVKAHQRIEAIVKRYRAGVPISEISAKYGLTLARTYQVINKYCQKNGMEPPRARNRKSALFTLRKKILEVAKPYKGQNEKVYTLLESAADNVAQALEINQIKGEENSK